ncbi:hypothetical protein K2173_011736 [Erythroxylum novogranatense]|uniref:Serine aminopeptidase S33 domain-containing protein n=1 Tax=Erythroxylum novogranatense TaxID=1862640 RepID=A0AAV8TJJ5_9ROSI|nr:hypothetical protein K2173_011736 [Erythroxylum novogranatense]
MEAFGCNFQSVLASSYFLKKPPSLAFPLRHLPFLSSRYRSSTVTLSMSALTAQNTVLQQQKIIVPNKHGEKLVGVLHDTGSEEVVVLCHGFRSSKGQELIENLAVALGNEGISAFRFDFSGNGESEGSFAYGNYLREADDLRAVVEHFFGEKRVISAILGHSKGGDVVLLYASKYHDVNKVVNISGRYDLKRGIEERLGKGFLEKIKEEGFIDVKNQTGGVNYRVYLDDLMDRLNTDMHKACLEIDRDCRVFTVHGSDDEIIPLEDAYEFSKIIPNHNLHIIDGANHSYTSHQVEVVSIVLDFIKANLQLDKASTS